MIADRAEDLAANDTHAASSIDAITTNTVGTGLTPQSRPNGKMLGWKPDQVRAFQEQAEWAFHIWQKEAGAGGRHSFWQLCFISMRSLLVKGEFFKIPLMVDRPGRTFSLALQSVDPLRIYTPQDKTGAKNIKDGVEFGRYGMPTAYWVANPEDGFIARDLSSKQFTRVRARAGHRPGGLHVFMAKSEEQLRGISILAPAMKFFKDLNDYLDFELVGAIVASSFPVFIETVDPVGAAAGFDNGPGPDGSEKNRYQEVAPGQVLLRVNFPGGLVSGCKALADSIATAGQTKKIYAYADGGMCSAAYWIGSAVGEIAAPVTASVGSIGVRTIHVDWSKWNDKAGLSFTHIAAGAYKTLGNEDESLSKQAKDYIGDLWCSTDCERNHSVWQSLWALQGRNTDEIGRCCSQA
jgi:hypothetical protein